MTRGGGLHQGAARESHPGGGEYLLYLACGYIPRLPWQGHLMTTTNINWGVVDYSSSKEGRARSMDLVSPSIRGSRGMVIDEIAPNSRFLLLE